jgi:hypothetical protein
VYDDFMKLPFERELAEQLSQEDKLLVQKQQEERAEQERAREAAEYQDALKRAQFIGQRATRWFRRESAVEEFFYSKAGNVALESEQDGQAQVRVLFKPPVYADEAFGFKLKPLGHDETKIELRLLNPDTGAHTDFVKLASFGNGRIALHDTNQFRDYGKMVEPGSDEMGHVREILAAVEAAKLNLKP